MIDKELTEALEGLQRNLEQHLDGKIKPMEEREKLNQEALDKLLAKSKIIQIGGANKSFGESFSEKIASEFSQKAEQVKAFQNDRNAKLRFELKVAGDMSIAASLTGDGQASYSPRQGILPSQRVNFRDLIPTTHSESGVYAGFRESAGEGTVSIQSEGDSKSQLDFDFTEVKTVSKFLAGWCRFSKQMMYQLPWLQSSLMRMLLRSFYIAENNYFYSTVAAAATGFDTSSESDPAKKIIDYLMGRADENFNNSFILVSNSYRGTLLKTMYSSGYYQGSGSVLGLPDGSVRIADVPIIGVSWAEPGSVMIIDSDFLERVETESLRIDFSYEDADNFRRNLVTSRVECFEDLNVILPQAHSYIPETGS